MCLERVLVVLKFIGLLRCNRRRWFWYFLSSCFFWFCKGILLFGLIIVLILLICILLRCLIVKRFVINILIVIAVIRLMNIVSINMLYIMLVVLSDKLCVCLRNF